MILAPALLTAITAIVRPRRRLTISSQCSREGLFSSGIEARHETEEFLSSESEAQPGTQGLQQEAEPVTSRDEFDFSDIARHPGAYYLLPREGERIGKLQQSFNKLRNYVVLCNSEWIITGGTLKAKAEHLTGLASIATFLGTLQIGFMTFAAGGNLKSLGNSFNILSYCALLVDSFSALFSVLASGSFSLAASPTKDYTAPKQTVGSRFILAQIRNRKRQREGGGEIDLSEDKKGLRKIMKYVEDCNQACNEELRIAEELTEKLRGFSKRDTIEYPIILFFTSVGAYLFVVSAIMFVIQTQPRLVSITIVTVAGVFTSTYVAFAFLHLEDRFISWMSMTILGNFIIERWRRNHRTWDEA